MLIENLDLDGNVVFFNSERFVRMRPSFGATEPPGTVTIRLESKRIHSASDPTAIGDALQEHLPVCLLTDPTGATNWLSARRVLNISAPTSQHHPSAQSVVSLHIDGGSSVDYTFRETVTDAQSIIANALADWPSS